MSKFNCFDEFDLDDDSWSGCANKSGWALSPKLISNPYEKNREKSEADLCAEFRFVVHCPHNGMVLSTAQLPNIIALNKAELSDPSRGARASIMGVPGKLREAGLQKIAAAAFAAEYKQDNTPQEPMRERPMQMAAQTFDMGN